jgi:mono/diheme cytochrome c family protein
MGIKLIIGLGLILSGGSFSFSNLPMPWDLNSSHNYTAFKEDTKHENNHNAANGKEVYADFCMQCHLADGKGDGKNFPPLDGSDWLSNKRTESIKAVKYGQTGEILVKGKKFNNSMPPMGLSNQEVVDVMNYIMTSWSNKQVNPVTLIEVEAIKQ